MEGCVISGPLALDGAISMESVKHKAIKDPVAGQADILLVPFIEIGNVLYKACSYIAGKTMASTICGASCPVIITSRADTPDSKYYSILMAVLLLPKGVTHGDIRRLSDLRAGAAPAAGGRAQPENVRGIHGVF